MNGIVTFLVGLLVFGALCLMLMFPLYGGEIKRIESNNPSTPVMYQYIPVYSK